MKNFTLFIFLLFFCELGFSQTNKKFTFKFKEADFEIVKSKNGLSEIKPLTPDFYIVGDTTEPALPSFTASVLIPSNATVKSYNFTVKSSLALAKDIVIKQCPRPIRTSEAHTYQEKEFAVYSASIYPQKNVLYASDYITNGYKSTCFIICPFIYNVNNKELQFIKEIEVEIILETVSLQKGISVSAGPKNDIKPSVVNAEEFEALYPQVQSQTKSISTKSTRPKVEYLIVTSQALMKSFEPLANWKTFKGVPAKIISLEEIYNTYSGGNNQLKIKSCLQDYYLNNGLKWVLLGGDDRIVPTVACYTDLFDVELVPTDLFYACFDNDFRWDAGRDGVLGDDYDNIDLAPEVYIARFPIRTAEHVKAMIDKTLAYEKSPPTTNYVNRMLMAGVKTSYIEDDGRSDTQIESDYVYNTGIQSFWNGAKYSFFDTYTDFPGGASYQVNVTNLQNQLNTGGYHFFDMYTHGHPHNWNLEAGNDYDRTDASRLTNKNKPLIVITESCNSNEFDFYDRNIGEGSDPCLSEAFLRNPNGGALLYWGSTRSGFGGVSYYFSEQFYNKLFSGITNEKNKFAAITTEAKKNFIPKSTSSGSMYRYLQFGLNAMGDPELPIYTDGPFTFNDVQIRERGLSVTVMPGVPGRKITVCSLLDAGQSYNVSIDDNSGNGYTFYAAPMPYSICITKTNYIPYHNVSRDVYIQNQVFTLNGYYIGRNIYAGSNVTSTQSQGPVTVKSGSLFKIYYGSSVTLDKGFEVEIGATLETQKIEVE